MLVIKLLGNGLGDQMLDIIGGIVLARICSYEKVLIIWKTIPQTVSSIGSLIYDHRLFHFDCKYIEVKIIGEHEWVMSRQFNIVHFPNPSMSSSPRRLLQWLCQNCPSLNIGLEDIFNLYHEVAASIRPGDALIPYLTPYENMIGFHVRIQDKINEHVFMHDVFVNVNDYLATLPEILLSIKQLTLDTSASIYVCGDKRVICSDHVSKLKELGVNDERFVNIPPLPEQFCCEYAGADAVRDMFLLSKCTTIVQNMNYSTFSLLSSLIGKKPLKNFWLGRGRTLLYEWTLEDYSHVYTSDPKWQNLSLLPKQM